MTRLDALQLLAADQSTDGTPTLADIRASTRRMTVAAMRAYNHTNLVRARRDAIAELFRDWRRTRGAAEILEAYTRGEVSAGQVMALAPDGSAGHVWATLLMLDDHPGPAARDRRRMLVQAARQAAAQPTAGPA